MSVPVHRFQRNCLDRGLRDTSSWPTADPSRLSAKRQARFFRCRGGVQAYMDGRPVKDVCVEYGMCRSELKRLRERCLATHPDGRIWGWRALLPYKRQKPYVRLAVVSIQTGKGNGGRAGALGQLFDRFPQFKVLVDTLFLKLVDGRTVHESRIPLVAIHHRLLQACREAGLTAKDYPFCVKHMGGIALFYYLRGLFKTRTREAVLARYGKNAARKLDAGGSGASGDLIMRPCQRVQFDAHRIDVLCILLTRHPYGGFVKRLLNRLWLLTIIDVASRAVLGYHLCLNEEYNSNDVLICVRNAVRPWVPKKLTIPGLEYPKGGGLPSAVSEKLAWALWDQLLYDSAKANLSDIVQEKLTRVLGCAVNAGPVATPETRAILERLFLTLEENGYHRLPSTTGSNPKDPRRVKPEEEAMRFEIMVEHIEELTDVTIAHYNGAPTAGLAYRSPLEMLEFFVADEENMVRTMPESDRNKLNFLNLKVTVTVRGNLANGTAPYVQFQNTRYQNEVLARSPDLINTDLDLEIDTQDPRTAKAYFLDGSELGILTAHGIWGVRPHTLEMRRAAFSLRHKRRIYFTENDDAIQIYLDYLASTDPNDRRASGHLAKARDYMVEPELPAASSGTEEDDSSPDSETKSIPLKTFTY